ASPRGPRPPRPAPLPRTPGAATMTECHRFEEEGLAQLERGMPVEEHFTTCADCRAARATYERLGRALRSVGADVGPPAGWQERVGAAAAADDRSRSGGRRLWWVPVGMAAAAAAVAVALWSPPRVSAPPGLQVTVGSGGISRRGLDAQPGDRVTLHAST